MLWFMLHGWDSLDSDAIPREIDVQAAHINALRDITFCGLDSPHKAGREAKTQVTCTTYEYFVVEPIEMIREAIRLHSVSASDA